MNDNPVLDTREYVVEFEDGEDAELVANITVQTIYTQCDPDGNQYAMFDLIVDFRRCAPALYYADQRVV